MNEPGTPEQLTQLFEQVLEGPVEKKDDAFDNLQKENERLRDSRRDERFCWIIVVIILLDILLLKDASNMVLPIIVGGMQVALLIALALKLGMEEVNLFMDRVLEAWGRNK